jgi:hypothetical protein
VPRWRASPGAMQLGGGAVQRRGDLSAETSCYRWTAPPSPTAWNQGWTAAMVAAGLPTVGHIVGHGGVVRRGAIQAVHHEGLPHRAPGGSAQSFGVVYTAPPI